MNIDKIKQAEAIYRNLPDTNHKLFEDDSHTVEVLKAALLIGSAILESGGEIARTESTIKRICQAYGMEKVDIFVITSCIFATIQTKSGKTFTQIQSVPDHNIDLNELMAINQLSRDVCSNPLPPKELIQKRMQIHRQAKLHMISCILIWSWISSAFCVFFGGSGSDAACSAIIGLILGLIRHAFKKIELNNYYSLILLSLLGGMFIVILKIFGLPINPSSISIGNIMLLIPGLTLTNSIRDLFSGDTLSGLLRLSESTLLSLVIAFGFAITTTGTDISFPWSDSLYYIITFLATLGFARLFHLGWKDASIGAVVGTIAWFIVLTAQHHDARLFTQYFLASATITLLSEVLARVRHCPVTVFLVLGIIPLVPGGGLYRTMRLIIEQDLVGFLHRGLSTATIAFAISAGIIAITALEDVFLGIKRQIS